MINNAYKHKYKISSRYCSDTDNGEDLSALDIHKMHLILVGME